MMWRKQSNASETRRRTLFLHYITLHRWIDLGKSVPQAKEHSTCTEWGWNSRMSFRIKCDDTRTAGWPKQHQIIQQFRKHLNSSYFFCLRAITLLSMTPSCSVACLSVSSHYRTASDCGSGGTEGTSGEMYATKSTGPRAIAHWFKFPRL